MKKILVLFLAFSAKLALAQAPGYDDLRILYADGNFEKLVRISSSYAEKDKTKNDAVVHLWYARGLYKISVSGSSDEKFKNAYKDAIGEMGKCLKLDKSKDVQTEYAEFINEFKNSLVELIGNDISIPDYKKASSWVIKYYKLDINSIGSKYLEGTCKFRNGDKGGANTNWKDADKKLTAITSIEDWSPADKQLLKMGVLQSAECLVSTRQTDKAKALLGKVAQWYESDEEFKAKYDEIVN